MTKRLRDWQSRLGACLAERMLRPFAWGSHDCVLFAADCVLACTGTDLGAPFRGTYRTALQAQRIVDEMGGLAGIAAAHMGAEVAPLMAQAGDVGLLLNEGRECLGVFGGSMWHAPGTERLCALPSDQVQRAWRLVRDQSTVAGD